MKRIYATQAKILQIQTFALFWVQFTLESRHDLSLRKVWDASLCSGYGGVDLHLSNVNDLNSISGRFCKLLERCLSRLVEALTVLKMYFWFLRLRTVLFSRFFHFDASCFCFFMWFVRFKILICEQQGTSFLYWVDFTTYFLFVLLIFVQFV